MKISLRRQRGRRAWMFPLLLAAFVVAASAWTSGQEPRERPLPSAPQVEAPRERPRGGDDRGDRRVPAPQERGDQEGTPEGVPQSRIAPSDRPGRPSLLPQRWILGVHAYNTSTGVLITRVAPGSAAAQIGLEPRDRIVSVDGFQVGEVNGQLYVLGDELQNRAGRNGRVRLLVQNCRNDRLENLDATLRRDSDYFRPGPRERE